MLKPKTPIHVPTAFVQERNKVVPAAMGTSRNPLQQGARPGQSGIIQSRHAGIAGWGALPAKRQSGNADNPASIPRTLLAQKQTISVPKVLKRPLAPGIAGIIQRAEIERPVPVNRSVVLRTLAKGTELYHSTKISDELVTAILKGAETLKSPAFFKDTPTNSYGPKLISFKVATNINVLDFCNPQTADALYHKLEAAELYDARDALQLKAHANIKNDVLVSMNKGIFKTKGSWDENLISGIRKLGYDGWIMPFSGFKEIMLLDASPVTAESAM